ncbi:LacI family transcriptional regulator [Agrobacterium rhizogenes]|uniref:LacI family DNA-binding transcriptional regulator n=1 Tax=Rhizobium rhizogenes TaxID=359 RepID=UPI00157450F9|nr:LacI family DNA-binding transcriptional regulator [Rhizobium rhizogenes]NTH16605.1 LacI family transcriptional regulator [Rhizobium rhizogenes]
MNDQRVWRNPTIVEIARAANVGTATVDRVLNGRDKVRDATRAKVMDAVSKLTKGDAFAKSSDCPKVAFLSDSGISFNASLQEAVKRYGDVHSDMDVNFQGVHTADFEPSAFARTIEQAAESADAIVVVAREDLIVSRSLRAVSKKIPVVCMTTDLPNSGRASYVGNDQINAGSAAAHLMGRLIGEKVGKVLIVISAPYRVQEERELGFRRVLRAEFAHLEIDDRVNSNDDADYSYQNLMQYLEGPGAPLGIYNVAGGNLGIGRALDASGLAGKTVFIGHELNVNSRNLLETGLMDVVIGHDVDHEVALSLKCIEALWARQPLPRSSTEIKIHTKFNCMW